MRITIDLDTSTLYENMTAKTALALGFLAGSLVTAMVLNWWNKRKTEIEDDWAEHLRKKLLTTASQDANASVLAGNTPTPTKSIATIDPTSSFLTDIVRELWTYVSVAGGDTIRASVEPYFKLYLPGPLKTLHFTKVDLGSNPLQMDNLRVRTIKNGTVQVDMDLLWDGRADIQMQTDDAAAYGMGKISLGVQNIKLCGQLCLWLKPLTNELPVISGIQYAFINPPHIDLKFTGLAAVADFAIIDKAVRDAIQASLLSYVLPKKGLYKMMSKNNFLDSYQPPVGIVCIKAISGRNFAIEKKVMATDDIPDVYLNITLGTSPVWRTRSVYDNLNPIWDESKEFVLHDQHQKITVHAWDYDKGPLDPDDDLGSASVLVSEILLQPSRKLELELELHQKKTQAFVTLKCNVFPWTTDLSSLNMSKPTLNNKENYVDGLLVVVINRGFQIPVPREVVRSFVKVTYTDQVFGTKQVSNYPGIDALNPLYETAFEIPMLPGMPTTGDEAKVTMELVNLVTLPDKVTTEEQVLGTLTIAFGDLKAAKDHTITEKKRIGEGGASMEYRISLCGVQRIGRTSVTKGGAKPGELHEPGSTPPRGLPTAARVGHERVNGIAKTLYFDEDDETPTPQPLGKVQLTIAKARGLNISHELFNIDIPDAYCNVKFGASEEVWKTSTQSNTCNPMWNESKQYDLLDHSQVVALELFDENERMFDPDVHLGGAKTTVGKVLLAGGSLELEANRLGRPTGIFITLKCELVDN